MHPVPIYTKQLEAIAIESTFNRYLAWAFIEAANFSIRRSEKAKLRAHDLPGLGVEAMPAVLGDPVAELFADPARHALRPAMAEGDFNVFQGDLSMHRVTPAGWSNRCRRSSTHSTRRATTRSSGAISAASARTATSPTMAPPILVASVGKMIKFGL